MARVRRKKKNGTITGVAPEQGFLSDDSATDINATRNDYFSFTTESTEGLIF